MSKYTITHACGHEETVQLYGPYKDRERKAAWMAEQDCPECRIKARAEAAKAKGLTEGTDKQIAWAADLIEAVEVYDSDLRDALPPVATAEVRAKIAALGANARAKLDAAVEEAKAALWSKPARAIIDGRLKLHIAVAKDAIQRLVSSL